MTSIEFSYREVVQTDRENPKPKKSQENITQKKRGKEVIEDTTKIIKRQGLQ